MEKYNLTYSLPNPVLNVRDLNSSFGVGTLKVAYTGINPNHTSFSKESFETSAPSMYNCPIVANYNVVDNTIGGHDMDVVDTVDGERIINITEPVGVIPESATYRFESINDNGVVHDYFCIDGVILWKRQACYSKLEQNGITSQSIEVHVTKGELDDGILHINEFEFEAFCLLERDEPCFEQASLQLFNKEDFKSQWKEMLQEYTQMLGGVEVQDKVQNIESVEASADSEIEIIETSVDESHTEESIGLQSEQNSDSDESIESEVQCSTSDSDHVESSSDQHKYSITASEAWDEFDRIFRDQPCFVQDFDDSTCYLCFYDEHKIYAYDYQVEDGHIIVDPNSAREVRLAYVPADDGFETDGLFNVINAIVDAAKSALQGEYSQKVDELNEKLEELTEFKCNVLQKERLDQESALFSRFDSQLKNVEAYKVLKENSSKYSVEDLEMQCFAILGKQKFSIKESNPMAARIPIDSSIAEESAYGGLLRNKTKITNTEVN